jgi:hypothetical protein
MPPAILLVPNHPVRMESHEDRNSIGITANAHLESSTGLGVPLMRVRLILKFRRPNLSTSIISPLSRSESK